MVFTICRAGKMPSGLTVYKPRIRDLRAGDVVVFEKFRRTVKCVEITCRANVRRDSCGGCAAGGLNVSFCD